MYKFLSENVGVTLTIKPSDKPEIRNYWPAMFWFDEHGTLWCRSNCLVKDTPRTDMNEEEFNKHISKMVADGFEIIINA